MPEQTSHIVCRSQRGKQSSGCATHSRLRERSPSLRSSVTTRYKIGTIWYKIATTRYKFVTIVHSCDYKLQNWDYKVWNYDYKVQNCDHMVHNCDYKVHSCDYEVQNCNYKVQNYYHKVHSCDFKIHNFDYKVQTCDYKVPTKLCFQVTTRRYQLLQILFTRYIRTMFKQTVFTEKRPDQDPCFFFKIFEFDNVIRKKKTACELCQLLGKHLILTRVEKEEETSPELCQLCGSAYSPVTAPCWQGGHTAPKAPLVRNPTLCEVARTNAKYTHTSKVLLAYRIPTIPFCLAK